jgi:hypothetical protein
MDEFFWKPILPASAHFSARRVTKRKRLENTLGGSALFETGEKIHVTGFDELKCFITQELSRGELEEKRK